MRDDFSQTTKDTLAARAGHVCSNPHCRAPTSGPGSIEGRSLSLGVAAHITAASPGGPRYLAGLSAEERKNISNGIWLCTRCSSEIDKDHCMYPIDLLHNWKSEAEYYARSKLGRPKTFRDSLNLINDMRPNQAPYFSTVRVSERDCLWDTPDFESRTGRMIVRQVRSQRHSLIGRIFDKRVLDPVFDVVISGGNRNFVIEKVGIIFLCAWSFPKAVPASERIKKFDSIVLRTGPLEPNKKYFHEFQDPILIVKGGTYRYKLRIFEFSHNLPGTDGLLRLLFVASNDLYSTHTIHLDNCLWPEKG